MFMVAAQGKKEVDADIQAMSKAIGVWAKRKDIRPSEFADAMGWRYNHAFNVLRGKYPFVPSAWGTFQRAYSMDDFMDIARIARVDFSKKDSQE